MGCPLQAGGFQEASLISPSPRGRPLKSEWWDHSSRGPPASAQMVTSVAPCKFPGPTLPTLHPLPNYQQLLSSLLHLVFHQLLLVCPLPPSCPQFPRSISQQMRFSRGRSISSQLQGQLTPC